MTAVLWVPRNRGLSRPSPAPGLPDAVELRSTRPTWARFEGTNLPTSSLLTLHLQTAGNFRLHIEVDTNRGPRRFVYVPNNTRPTLRFGSRYFIGLGSILRNGEPQLLELDLQAAAERLEPGVVVGSITRAYIGVASSLLLLLGCTAGEPPPPPPGPTPPPESTPPPEEPPPEEPPPSEPPAPGSITRSEAVRFLTQATFGASQSGIADIFNAGSYETWIDQQLALTPSLTEPYVVATSNGSNSTARHEIWWLNAIGGPDQLRQRLAFAWSELFVVSDNDYTLSNSQYAITNYYDMLTVEATGNFRNMLERVTLHPVMGVYLSHLRNQRADPERNIRPDENFAREVLQLFTIGLHELNQDGSERLVNGQPITTYDQRTIEEFAKLFTGWNYADTDSFDDNRAHDRRLPMVPFEAQHEPEAKELLNGLRLNSGGTTRSDTTAALDNIFNHPNVGPFVARHLIQRLVTSNPTPAYIGRVAGVFNNNGSGVRGDLLATSKAVLLDAEARQGHVTLPQRFGKFKEPLMRLSQLWRAFDVEPNDVGIHRPYAIYLYAIDSIVGQQVMSAPSVFNFYPPDNPLGAGSTMVSPEASILTEIDVASTNNMLFQAVHNDHNRNADERPWVSKINVEREVAMASNPAELVDHLDEILLASSMPSAFRSALISHLGIHPDTDEGLLLRTLDAMYCVVGSAFHLVQK